MCTCIAGDAACWVNDGYFSAIAPRELQHLKSRNLVTVTDRTIASKHFQRASDADDDATRILAAAREC
eukprot:6094689-Pyramimonas_sp.AAC.1